MIIMILIMIAVIVMMAMGFIIYTLYQMLFL
jgi:hypothetical protein